MDGRDFVFQPFWIMDGDDTSIYVDEWAMGPRHYDDWPDDAPGWVASGDLVNLRVEAPTV